MFLLAGFVRFDDNELDFSLRYYFSLLLWFISKSNRFSYYLLYFDSWFSSLILHKISKNSPLKRMLSRGNFLKFRHFAVIMLDSVPQPAHKSAPCWSHSGQKQSLHPFQHKSDFCCFPACLSSLWWQQEPSCRSPRRQPCDS